MDIIDFRVSHYVKEIVNLSDSDANTVSDRTGSFLALSNKLKAWKISSMRAFNHLISHYEYLVEIVGEFLVYYVDDNGTRFDIGAHDGIYFFVNVNTRKKK